MERKRHAEIWGEPGHAIPYTWMVPYKVDVVFNDGRPGKTVTIKMMSRYEWKDRIKRVTALRMGWDEKSFQVIDYRMTDDDDDDCDCDGYDDCED